MSLDVWLIQHDDDDEGHQVWEYNITHNLNKMAEDAGLYDVLWRPEVCGYDRAEQITKKLSEGLGVLLSDRPRFEKFNPENGWGNYDNLVDFVFAYIKACQEYPDAEIHVSR